MSTLVETIKAQMKTAMKARDDVAKNILRLALSEIQLAEARGQEVDDAAGHKIIRKLLASNDETLQVTTEEGTRTQLQKENEILLALVPQQLGVEQIIEVLAPVRDAIAGAKADGPAMGLAMKHLKSTGAAVEGDSVRQAITQIRGGAS